MDLGGTARVWLPSSVSDVYGVAPGSSLLSYRIPFGTQDDQASEDCFNNDGYVAKTEPIWVLNQAMNDGAQIINLSASSNDGNDPMKWTVARAMSSGVILVAAAGNDGFDNDDLSLSKWSGVVGVTAISTDGTRQEYSSWGEGVVTASIGGPVLFRNFDTGANDTVSALRLHRRSSRAFWHWRSSGGRRLLPISCCSCW